MLDRAHLQDFMNRFYGYGSWDVELWFIGMEERGGNSMDEVERRLNAWDGRSRKRS